MRKASRWVAQVAWVVVLGVAGVAALLELMPPTWSVGRGGATVAGVFLLGGLVYGGGRGDAPWWHGAGLAAPLAVLLLVDTVIRRDLGFALSRDVVLVGLAAACGSGGALLGARVRRLLPGVRRREAAANGNDNDMVARAPEGNGPAL